MSIIGRLAHPKYLWLLLPQLLILYPILFVRQVANHISDEINLIFNLYRPFLHGTASVGDLHCRVVLYLRPCHSTPRLATNIRAHPTYTGSLGCARQDPCLTYLRYVPLIRVEPLPNLLTSCCNVSLLDGYYSLSSKPHVPIPRI